MLWLLPRGNENGCTLCYLVSVLNMLILIAAQLLQPEFCLMVGVRQLLFFCRTFIFRSFQPFIEFGQDKNFYFLFWEGKRKEKPVVSVMGCCLKSPYMQVPTLLI